MAFMFEKLEVYQRALVLADQIIALGSKFPREFRFLADQLSRASVSIAANIAEGNGRHTKGDRRNFFVIARGSSQECIPLLEIARRRTLITHEQLELFKSELETIAKMLSGLIKGIANRRC